MKAKKKNGQGLYLRRRNNRWKWMAGATAATAAGVTAQASTITINLTGNYISSTGGNHLNADLTGDGHPDLTIAGAFYYASVRTRYYGTYEARVSLNGVGAYEHRHQDNVPNSGFEQLGSRAASWHRYSVFPYSTGTDLLTGSIPLFFKDLHINGGAPTSGLLQVTVSSGCCGDGIYLDSLTYNTPVQGSSRAVPDQGSSLALLAMGAGGVLALRRWRAAQGHS
jgi:hypothetical protein